MVISLIVGAVILAALIFWILSSMRPPQGVEVAVEVPDEVRAGEGFELVVRVHNRREGKPAKLSEISIDNSFHDAISVSSVEPTPKMEHDMQLAVVVLYGFEIEIPAGGEQVVTFSAEASRPGTAQGELIVFEGRKGIKAALAVEILPAE